MSAIAPSHAAVAAAADDLRLNRHVKRGDRLIADNQLWLKDQRPRDADTLTLTAGELVRISG